MGVILASLPAYSATILRSFGGIITYPLRVIRKRTTGDADNRPDLWALRLRAERPDSKVILAAQPCVPKPPA